MMAASGSEIVHANLTNILYKPHEISQDSKIITQALALKSTNQNGYVNIFSLEFSLRILAITQKSHLGRTLISFPCRFDVATVASMV